MATYVNDLRLTELATGEGSGTWGTTTNTNLELIGEALGYGTQDCFASDADATTTVADGASDPARAMYFKVTSSATLTATRTLTIAPNTVSRVMLIENATTGSQSIAISQGSGGNVTIASGQTKMVYLDGAGATGAVVDALADLELGTITVADLTATTADINGGTIDGVTIGGSSAGAITGTTGQFNTSLNVDGTVTADGLTVGNGTQQTRFYIDADEVSQLIDGNVRYDIWTGGDKTMRLDANGDISFYEDTGTTPKFFWDASAESLGIGTTSPSQALHIDGGNVLVKESSTAGKVFLSNTSVGIKRSDAVDSTNARDVEVFTDGSGANVVLSTNGAGSAEFVLDDSGNVGIGTSSPSSKLHIVGATSSERTLIIEDAFGNDVKIQASVSGGNASMVFKTEDTEAMRIDSSQNLLVGTISNDPADNNASSAIELQAAGQIQASATSARVIAVNRKSTDGEIINLRKDGSTVGSISTYSGGIDLAGSSRGIRLTGSSFFPVTNAGGVSDNTTNLGYSGGRFKDLYLTGGVYLGGTGAANLLDDYEEGTWTPTIEGSTSGSITGFTISGANYTKVGRVVNLNCYLSSVDISSSTISGEVRIASLPFTSANFTGVILSTYCNWFTLDESDITVSGYTQGAELRLLKGSSTSPITDSDLSTGVTNGVIMVNVVYMTS